MPAQLHRRVVGFADDVVSETYHSAVELGGHALTAFGVHPLRSRQMTWAFINNEKSHEDELFDAWKEIEEGIRFSPRYGELFMKLEDTLSDVMQQDWDCLLYTSDAADE